MADAAAAPSLKDQIVDWAILGSRHGASWWMPLLLIAVSALNSLTGGMFFWCIGICQAVLFTTVGMSNKWVGVVVAPICLTMGASVAALTYIHLAQSSGIDALLEKAGVKDSAVLVKTQEMAKDWGVAGLIFIQVNPLTPVPTAVLVVAGVLAKMNEYTVFTVLMTGKFLSMLLNSILVYVASQGKTVEEVLREQFKPGEAAAAGEKKDE